MKKLPLAFKMLCLVLSLPVGSVWASGNIVDACGAVLDKPGNYVLGNNISSCPGFAILIIASNVSLNLAGYEVSCESVDGRFDVGIEIAGVSGVHVRNGTVSGCDIGVDLFQSNHSIVNNVTAMGNVLDPFFTGLGIGGYEASHNLIIGNHVHGNTIGMQFAFGGNNRIVGNIANENFRSESAPFPTFGIGIAAAFSDNNRIIGNEVSLNTDAGIVLAHAATGNVVRENLALGNENYGIGMFSREDFGTPLAYGNLIQSNVALGSGRADMMEAKFDPYAVPREIVQPDCVNSWKDNTFESVIAPDSCVE